jgi:hypothetical protein
MLSIPRWNEVTAKGRSEMGDRRTAGDRRVSDRRQAQRSPVDCQIRLLSAKTPSQVLQGSLLDVSATGMRLVLSQPISIGEKLLIEARRSSRVVCNVTVQVIWVEAGAVGQINVGCESIADLSPRQLSQLKSAATDVASVATV